MLFTKGIFELVLVIFSMVYSAHACTSMMIGPEATVDGSIWVGQSDDGEGAGDTRLVKVHPRDWPAGALRPIVDYGNYTKRTNASSYRLSL